MNKLRLIVYCAAGVFFFAAGLVFPASANWTPGLAVAAGMLFGALWGNPCLKYTAKYTSQLLGACIVGMGFGLDLPQVWQAGKSGFLFTLAGIILAMFLARWLGRYFKISDNTAALIGVGSAICGGSAIASAAPAIKAEAHEIAIAGITVFTLNAAALWLFPVIGHQLEFDQTQFGYWAALAIHDTSSVVGACLQYGKEALEVGTTVKLARALWIIPVTLVLSIACAGKSGNGKKFRLAVPWFIPGFLLAAALATIFSPVREIAPLFQKLAKNLMVLALYMIGSNLSREKLRELGWRPILAGLILWVFLSTFWCVMIHCGLVGN